MQIVDPDNLPKKPRKARALKGGEPFEAEPGATEASETWKKSQLARLKLRNEASRVNYGNAWAQLDPIQDYYVGRNESGEHNPDAFQWDEHYQRYFTKTYYKFKVTWRYYRGERPKSYLFWPSIVVPGYILLRQNFAGGTVEVVTDTGRATYVRIGTVEGTSRYGRDQEVWALWKSEGTMKHRRTKNNEGVNQGSAL
jgi:hypothetical protein